MLKEICGSAGEEKLRLSELAPGYGWVARHINNVIPSSIATACDIYQQATQFIQEKLETEGVLSAFCSEGLRLNGVFGVVFA